jgi:hypothetical protein
MRAAEATAEKESFDSVDALLLQSIQFAQDDTTTSDDRRIRVITPPAAPRPPQLGRRRSNGGDRLSHGEKPWPRTHYQ